MAPDLPPEVWSIIAGHMESPQKSSLRHLPYFVRRAVGTIRGCTHEFSRAGSQSAGKAPQSLALTFPIASQIASGAFGQILHKQISGVLSWTPS